MLRRGIRRLNPNATIKRQKWLVLGLLIIGAFGIVVFFNFRSLTKDVSFAHEYYAAIELDRLMVEDSFWAFNEETFDPVESAMYERFVTGTTGPFLEKVNLFLTEHDIPQMTFRTLQAPETVVFELSKTGSSELTAIAESTVTGFLRQSLERKVISPEVAKSISDQQNIYFVTIRTIGRREIGQEFLYTNGRYDSHPEDGLQWLRGNQFRFTHYLDVAQLTLVPNTAEQLENTTAELTKRRNVAGDNYRQQYLALLGLKEREVAKIPVIGVEVPIPEALAIAAVLATIYINLVFTSMNSLGPRQLFQSDEPWFLLDIAEPVNATWQNKYRTLSFCLVVLGHALVYMVPVMLAGLALIFASEPSWYAIAILGFFNLSGTLLALLSFSRLIRVVTLIRKKRLSRVSTSW